MSETYPISQLLIETMSKSYYVLPNQISIKYSCRIKKHLLFLLHE